MTRVYKPYYLVHNPNSKYWKGSHHILLTYSFLRKGFDNNNNNNNNNLLSARLMGFTPKKYTSKAFNLTNGLIFKIILNK